MILFGTKVSPFKFLMLILLLGMFIVALFIAILVLWLPCIIWNKSEDLFTTKKIQTWYVRMKGYDRPYIVCASKEEAIAIKQVEEEETYFDEPTEFEMVKGKKMTVYEYEHLPEFEGW